MPTGRSSQQKLFTSATLKQISSTESTVARNASLESTPTRASSELSPWQFPQTPILPLKKSKSKHLYGPLPLPVTLEASKFNTTLPSTKPSPSSIGNVSTTATSQLVFPPLPAVLGSQPLYYLAKRFPILAEQELKALPNKTALDYSSFLLGATRTAYPSATTLRAVIRQFRNFLKESARQLKASPSTLVYMELPRARIWTQMIRGLIWLKQYRRARVAIHAMQKLGIKPTGYAWRGICRGWIEQGDLDRAEALAAQVFMRPEISHDYQLEEKPYYFVDMSESAQDPARLKHRSPMSPNSAPLCLVIEALAECGEMERARYWFDRIPKHEMTDLLTSSMVAGYLRMGLQHKAQEVIRIMARCGVKPTAIVFNPIVEHAAKNIGMEVAEELVRDMIERGIFLNLFTYKALIRGYIATGQKDKALSCLGRIGASGLETDRALGRILLDGFYDIGTLRKGDCGPPAICEVNKTQEMEDEFGMDNLEFVKRPGWSQRCIAWIQSRKYEQLEEALQQVSDLGRLRTDAEAVQVIKALTDQQEMARARNWFDQLVSSGGSWQDEPILEDLMHHMVSGYLQTRQPKEAEAVLWAGSQRGAQPKLDTINLMLRWSTLHGEMQDAEDMVQRMIQSNITPNLQTFDVLYEGYASRGALGSLQECMVRMEEAFPGHVDQSPSTKELRNLLFGRQEPRPVEEESFATPTSPTSSSSGILDALCARWTEQDRLAQADQFVSELVSNPNVPISKIPFSTLIQGWIDQSQRNKVSSSAMQAIAQSQSRSGTSRTLAPSDSRAPTSSSVPSSESLNHEFRLRQESVGQMRKARYWFEKVPEEQRTLDLVNRMIGGYMALGLEHESEHMIQWLASHKIKPDVVTYNHILEHTVLHVTMPAAETLVNRMQKGGITPNVDTWNLLIRGYVIRGQSIKALWCLDRMTGKWTPPSSARAKLESPAQARSAKSKTREMIETYDREILDVVIDDDMPDEDIESDAIVPTRQARRSLRRPQDTVEPVVGFVEPNEMTEQLILAGFGPELKPEQGHGDYARALELYRNRVARQKQQKEKLLQGLASLTEQNPQLRPRSSLDHERDSDEEEEAGWNLDHLELLKRLGGLTGTDVGMTTLDWRNELKWEEMMEMEREQERELSGRSWPL
ncbi:hypothetical protein BGZ54_002354 [Gamsiella multidivaricata]|nr:hypothetical protein BGZ54_002354 [Gamsiella multidivaricata]